MKNLSRLLSAFLLFAVASSSCATINPIVCGTGNVLVPPDAKACTAAILTAAEAIPGAVVACAVEVASGACIDSILASVGDLAPCEPTCAPGPGTLGALASATPLRLSPAVLRVNMLESLKATGTHGPLASVAKTRAH